MTGLPAPPSPPTDPIAALLACHDRIRRFTAGLGRLVALPSLHDPRAPAAAAVAHRYFSEGLTLHMLDEDVSLAPRLLRAAPEVGPILAELADDHRVLDAQLGTLLPLLGDLAAGGRPPHALLRAASDALAAVILPHLEREEELLFPRCTALPLGDRVAMVREFMGRRQSPGPDV